jgi:uncharacterized phage-like protein YoqJ
MDNLNYIKKACFTGYRPSKFPFILDENNSEYNNLISLLNQVLIHLIENGCTVFYCGMAEGFDIICAESLLLLKKKYKNVRLVCVIPFLEHADSIKLSWSRRYNSIISHCDEVVYSAEEYHVSTFHIRNVYMVDHSDCVITWYNGKKGGTRNTLNYAQKNSKLIINLNKEYNIEFQNFQNRIEFT